MPGHVLRSGTDSAILQSSQPRDYAERHLARRLGHFWPGRLANAGVWHFMEKANAYYLGSAQTITVTPDSVRGPIFHPRSTNKTHHSTSHPHNQSSRIRPPSPRRANPTEAIMKTKPQQILFSF